LTVPSAAERILRLAPYLDASRSGDVTLSDITADVTGYDDGTAPRDEDGGLEQGKEWEALRKKLRRDLDDLEQQWGIEVLYDEHTHCYRLASPFLSARQRAALISAAAVVAVQGLSREPGAIGSGVSDGAARVIIQVHDYVATFRDAIQSRTAVRFRHEGRERVLEPWALGVWRNKWYVAGGDPLHDDEMRRFRLDRIAPVADATQIVLDGEPDAFTIPGWFDVDRAFDFDPNSWGHDPELDARVRVERDHVDAFLHEFGGEVVDRDEAGGVVTVALVVRHYESFRNRLFGLRGHAVVESPPELVALVREHLEAVSA
jgi:predicted DNA-binding transcriptional regulator YafY